MEPVSLQDTFCKMLCWKTDQGGLNHVALRWSPVATWEGFKNQREPSRLLSPGSWLPGSPGLSQSQFKYWLLPQPKAWLLLQTGDLWRHVQPLSFASIKHPLPAPQTSSLGTRSRLLSLVHCARLMALSLSVLNMTKDRNHQPISEGREEYIPWLGDLRIKGTPQGGDGGHRGRHRRQGWEQFRRPWFAEWWALDVRSESSFPSLRP